LFLLGKYFPARNLLSKHASHLFKGKPMKTTLSRCAIAAFLLGTSALAHATVVFDSSLGAYGTTTSETRGSDRNYAAVLSFSHDVKVSQIGVFTTVDNAQDIKFLVFDSASAGGTGALLLSDQKSFAQNTTQTFVYSDLIDFTFLANHTYDVGILGSTGTLTGFWGIGNYVQNGITGFSNNANISHFNAPTTGDYAGVLPYIQLVTADAKVPEPVSAALFGLGLAGLACARRKAQQSGNA
jgi:hypothetical protein